MLAMSAPLPATTYLLIRDLGKIPYAESFAAMRAFTLAREDFAPNEVWLLQHPPVFTQGLNGQASHVLMPGDIPVVASDRGGQVSYHGPGQLVAYLLFDLARAKLGVRELVDRLENALVALLTELGVEAHSRLDAPGVYVGECKIASLGLKIRKGRCYHGLALNVDMDLSPFTRINPCGYAGLRMCQVRDFVPNITLDALKRPLACHLASQLELEPLFLDAP